MVDFGVDKCVRDEKTIGHEEEEGEERTDQEGPSFSPVGMALADRMPPCRPPLLQKRREEKLKLHNR